MKLVIIGNGFDMAHGLKSGYGNFKEYIQKNDIDEYEFLETLFGSDFNKDEFWWNFEESLSKNDFENFSESIELNNDDQRKNGFEDENCEESNSSYFAEHICRLKKMFCEWIYTINENEINDESKKEKICTYFDDSIVMTFNYTSTVEELYGVNCFHIHGYIENVDLENEIGLDSIVLGHSFNLSLLGSNDEEINSDDVYCVSDDGESIPFSDLSFVKVYNCSNSDYINDSLSNADSTYQQIFTKRCNKIINEDNCGFFMELERNAKDIDEIIVLGHSISEIDRKYYEKIVDTIRKNNKTIKWIVSYYGGEEAKLILKNNLFKIDKNANPVFITIND